MLHAASDADSGRELTIVDPAKRTFRLRCATSEARDDWVAGLQATVALHATAAALNGGNGIKLQPNLRSAVETAAEVLPTLSPQGEEESFVMVAREMERQASFHDEQINTSSRWHTDEKGKLCLEGVALSEVQECLPMDLVSDKCGEWQLGQQQQQKPVRFCGKQPY